MSNMAQSTFSITCARLRETHYEDATVIPMQAEWDEKLSWRNAWVNRSLTYNHQWMDDIGISIIHLSDIRGTSYESVLTHAISMESTNATALAMLCGARVRSVDPNKVKESEMGLLSFIILQPTEYDFRVTHGTCRDYEVLMSELERTIMADPELLAMVSLPRAHAMGRPNLAVPKLKYVVDTWPSAQLPVWRVPRVWWNVMRMDVVPGVHPGDRMDGGDTGVTEPDELLIYALRKGCLQTTILALMCGAFPLRTPRQFTATTVFEYALLRATMDDAAITALTTARHEYAAALDAVAAALDGAPDVAARVDAAAAARMGYVDTAALFAGIKNAANIS